MDRLITLAIAGFLLAPTPAYAHGEQIVIILAIDAALFIAAILAIALILKGPLWMRALLVASYVTTWCILFVLPLNLIQPPWLNGPFHFALPVMVCALVYIGYKRIGSVLRHEAPP